MIKCVKWFAKFCARDFLLDDAPQSGKPVEVYNNQIETLIQNNQQYHLGESRHTDKIKINKLPSENEKCVFHFTEKTYRLFGQPTSRPKTYTFNFP